MRLNSEKTFEYLCLAASVTSWVAILMMFLTGFPNDFHLSHKGWSLEKNLIEVIFDVLQVAAATIIASPILGLPYWLALLISRRQNKVAKFLLYFYVGFMAFAFLGHAMYSSVLTLACVYYLTEVVLVSLSFFFLSSASQNVRKYKY